jgi:catechol 2,3-dioxygenase-like lactoylglutathione lyase family enzyme
MSAIDGQLSHLFVRVTDLVAARHFYVDLLGLEVLMEGGGYLRVGNTGGWHIGMEEGEPVGADGVELVIRVPDVDDAHARLTAAGILFEAAPTAMPWGARHAWLRDPSGYRLSLYS